MTLDREEQMISTMVLIVIETGLGSGRASPRSESFEWPPCFGRTSKTLFALVADGGFHGLLSQQTTQLQLRRFKSRVSHRLHPCLRRPQHADCSLVVTFHCAVITLLWSKMTNSRNVNIRSLWCRPRRAERSQHADESIKVQVCCSVG